MDLAIKQQAELLEYFIKREQRKHSYLVKVKFDNDNLEIDVKLLLKVNFHRFKR